MTPLVWPAQALPPLAVPTIAPISPTAVQALALVHDTPWSAALTPLLWLVQVLPSVVALIDPL